MFLYCHKDIATNTSTIVDIFANKIPRKLLLFELFTVFKGGRHLPYLEKNINSLGIVTLVPTRKNHGYGQEIMPFYISPL